VDDFERLRIFLFVIEFQNKKRLKNNLAARRLVSMLIHKDEQERDVSLLSFPIS